MKTNLLITGKPGCGKTTLIKKIAKRYAEKVAGFYTEEIREKGQRVGFRICALSGEAGILAEIGSDSIYRVGKYGVNIEDLESIGVKSLSEAIEAHKVVLIDEIGKMELFSDKFQSEVLRALNSPQKVLATITLGQLAFTQRVRERVDCEVIYLRRESFDLVLVKIIHWLGKLSGKTS